MGRFLAGRLAATLPVMGIVAVIVFLLLRLAPGDPAAILAGDAASPEQIAAIRANLGLDKPILTQFLSWSGRLLQGDLGSSIISNQPVAKLIFRADRADPGSRHHHHRVRRHRSGAPRGAGGLVARHLDRSGHHGRLGAGLLGAGLRARLPADLRGFAMQLRFLPVQGYVSITEGIWPFLSRLILPTLTLSVIYVALIARTTRSSVLEVLGEDYIRTARAKGIGESQVLWRHALRNAAVPVVSVIGLGIALLISGVVVTESVFNLPGLGRLTVDAVLAHDYPVIQGVILLFSALYVVVNLAIDLSYLLFDPRIRY